MLRHPQLPDTFISISQLLWSFHSQMVLQSITGMETSDFLGMAVTIARGEAANGSCFHIENGSQCYHARTAKSISTLVISSSHCLTLLASFCVTWDWFVGKLKDLGHRMGLWISFSRIGQLLFQTGVSKAKEKKPFLCSTCIRPTWRSNYKVKEMAFAVPRVWISSFQLPHVQAGIHSCEKKWCPVKCGLLLECCIASG